ncbi:hypothetical protein EC968_000174 [Mortierella alpina]|nr:hypothetical protein EC968_000174 [Mortierella alpina]
MRVQVIKAVIVALATAATTSSVPLHDYIVGGTRVKEGEFPSFVLSRIATLRIGLDREGYLGGVNANEGKLLKPVKAITHSNFHQGKLTNDIRLVFLSEKVGGPYGSIEDVSYPEEGSKLMVAGYDRTITDGNMSKILLKLQITTAKEVDCVERKTDGNGTTFFDPRTQFCSADALGSAACYGDSDGPLYTGSGKDVRVVGLVSSPGDILECAEKGAYIYYTFIKPYLPWIKSEIEKFEKNGANSTTEAAANW